MRWSQHLPQGPIPCPLWLPPWPGYPGMVFTAAQKCHIGMYDRYTSCHLLGAPNTKGRPIVLQQEGG